MLYVIDNDQSGSGHCVYFVESAQPRESMELLCVVLEMKLSAIGLLAGLDGPEPKSMTLATFCDEWSDCYTSMGTDSRVFDEDYTVFTTLPESFALEADGEFLEAWRAARDAR